MDPLITRRTRDLRKGRESKAGATYFVTTCTKNREKGLAHDEIAAALTDSLRQLQRNQDLELLCGTIMPDHVHVLFTLGAKNSLSRTQQKFKSLTKRPLETRGFKWQGNFYDHRLREKASAEAFAFYMFMNPYRQGLLQLDERWPYWILNKTYKPEFMGTVESGKSLPEPWLAKEDPLTELIAQDR